MRKRIFLLFFLIALASALWSWGPRKLPIPADADAAIPDGASNPDAAINTDGVANSDAAPKLVAFTFDDGPRRGTTDTLLDGLAERGAKATFFLVGQEIENAPDLARRMRDEGHQIGNHTWSHARLDEASDEEITREIGETDALLQSVAGTGEYWLRPPYGFLRTGTESLIGTPVVLWSVDPRDWESRDTEKIIQAVTESVKPGDIILLHDIYPTSVAAALRLTDALSADGYEFVTVAELLRRNGIDAQAGASYRGADG